MIGDRGCGGGRAAGSRVGVFDTPGVALEVLVVAVGVGVGESGDSAREEQATTTITAPASSRERARESMTTGLTSKDVRRIDGVPSLSTRTHGAVVAAQLIAGNLIL
jgi:hypothetical protein